MEDSGFSLPKEVEGIDFRVTGINEEDAFVRDAVYKIVISSVKKITRINPVADFRMHIKRFKEKEWKGRIKYSIHANMMTDLGEFFAEGHDWDIVKATKLTLAKLEKEISRKEDREKVHTKAH